MAFRFTAVLFGRNRSEYITEPEVLGLLDGDDRTDVDDEERFETGLLETRLFSESFTGEDEGVLFINGFPKLPTMLQV